MQSRTRYGIALVLGGVLLLSPQAAKAQGALERLGNLLDQVQQNRPDRPNRPPPTDTIERPYLGAMLDSAVADADPQQNQGLLVTNVNPGGPAAQAGLQQGDRIMSIDGKMFGSLDELAAWMDEKKPGDRIVVKAIRDNSKTVGMTLVLGSQEVEVPVRPTRPDRPVPYDPLGVEEEMPLPADPLPPPVDNAPRVLGVRVVPLTDQIRAQTGVSVRRGAYVESVSRGSVADRANIPVGAVIVSYDGRRVDDAVGLIQMVRSSPADRTIPVNYYYGNRMESTQLYYGNPRDLPPPNDRDLGPGTPGANGDRPALRMLQNALEAVEGGEMPAGMVSQEQVDSLSRRVRDLEQEVRELREELRAMRNGRDL